MMQHRFLFRRFLLCTFTVFLLFSFEICATASSLSAGDQVEICGVSTDKQATFLDLSHVPMESAEELEGMLDQLPNLQKVDMIGCGLSNEEMDALNGRHPEINFVWTVDVGPFIDLRTDTQYFMPHLFGYKLTSSMCDNLKYCRDLVCIDLGHMEFLNCEFLRDTPQMEILILADTPLTDITPIGSLTKLQYLEIFMTKTTDYWPLVNCTSLKDLNASYTLGTDFSMFHRMTHLDRLWLTGNYLDFNQQEALRADLPNTVLAFRPRSSTGNGWRFSPRYFTMRDQFGMYYSWE